MDVLISVRSDGLVITPCDMETIDETILMERIHLITEEDNPLKIILCLHQDLQEKFITYLKEKMTPSYGTAEEILIIKLVSKRPLELFKSISKAPLLLMRS